MTKTREYLAQRARVRRAISQKLAKQHAAARRAHLAGVLVQIKSVISDQKFIDLLAEQRVRTVPDCLYKTNTVQPDVMTDEQIAKSVLSFVVAWKFLFPVLGSAKIVDYLEQTRPGFIADFKDTFITLVMDGPFPGMRRTPVRPTYFS